MNVRVHKLIAHNGSTVYVFGALIIVACDRDARLSLYLQGHDGRSSQRRHGASA